MSANNYFCPSQDSVVYSRLAPRDTIKSTTENHLNLFAEDGLRTLCIAQAVIDKEAYEVSQLKLWSHLVRYLQSLVIMPRCTCASEVYGSVFVCRYTVVCLCVCLCRLLQLLKDQ